MRILFLGNNWVAWQIVRWLRKQREEVVGLVLHSPRERKFGDEIIRSSGLDAAHILDGSKLDLRSVREKIESFRADIGLSVLFGYVFRHEIIDLFPHGIVNLHPSYLPYNRGAYPNVWSIVERTPAGVTIHYIDDQIDTGDIIARCLVPVESVDTGETLYRKLEQRSVELFKEFWPLIRSGEAPRLSQKKEAGTYHQTRDVEQIDRIDLDRMYRARDLIDLLRARTFPPFRGAYFMDQGRKIYLRLQLLNERQSDR